MTKVLHLSLFREWFDQILSGTKKVEYRTKKPHWTRLLFNKDGTTRHYDEIKFTNSYGSLRPKIRVEFLGVRERDGQYEIRLGKVLESLNMQSTILNLHMQL